ncbi:FAD-binding oxidoreductase [Variovorax sp. H27-G14]|uniref:ferredoxin reductase family protein n=1 Tax=Variovorax sp. H27-G14 TaxID=3111914 RepID=UPI0038FC073D
MKRVPYRVFRKTHRLLAVLFLVLGFHAVVLMPFAYWNQLIGSVMALLMTTGAIAALWILFDRVGLSRRVVGQVKYVASYASMNLLEVFVQLNNAWAGHKAGQFAFVTFNLNEGAHPFTISSAWEADGHMRFIIKELGDYTRTLALTIKPGDLVTIEGPYGQFDFTGRNQGQIWIGGGVGITPFIARMKALAIHNDGNPIDLFYCTAELDVSASDLLKHDASAARVNLHAILSARDGRLDGKRIRDTVPNWKANDIWFCGPAGLGKAVRRDLISSGMHPDAFHQELFEMR